MFRQLMHTSLAFVCFNLVYISSGCSRSNYTNVGNLSCCVNYYEDDGECLECPFGTYGVECSSICPKGYYGRLCRSKCSCSIGLICNPSEGCVEIAGNRTVNTNNGQISLAWIELIGLSAVCCLATAVFIAVVRYLKKCCHHYCEFPENIEALLRTLSSRFRRGVSLQGTYTDAWHSVLAVGRTEERYRKDRSGMRSSVHGCTTISTLPLQQSTPVMQEIKTAIGKNEPFDIEENETPESKTFGNIAAVEVQREEEREAKDEKKSALTRNCMESFQRTVINIPDGDNETLPSKKIPFSFQPFSQGPRERITIKQFDNDETAKDGTAADFSENLDTKIESHLQTKSVSESVTDTYILLRSNCQGSKVPYDKENAQINSINNTSKNKQDGHYTSLDHSKNYSHLYDVMSSRRPGREKEKRKHVT